MLPLDLIYAHGRTEGMPRHPIYTVVEGVCNAKVSGHGGVLLPDDWPN
jgi:hypothetical protein